MPRYAMVSSGRIAALFDSNLYMKSLYYPLLDQLHNHMVGGTSRIAIWKDGLTRWLEDLDKVVSMEDLVIKATTNIDGSRLSIEVLASSTRPAIIYRVHLDGDGFFRLIFYNDFRLNNSELGDTALYDPGTDAVIHYKHRTWIAVGSSQQLYEYTVGRRDQGVVLSECQNGVLSKNPIAQGSVDSAVSVASKDFYLFIVAGQSYSDVKRGLEYLRRLSSEQFEHDKRYWTLLTQRFQDDWVARQSVAILVGHVGVDGEIPASLDTSILKFNLDTYAYTWPRDAVMVALALDSLGYWSFTRRFYEKLFTELITEEGYFYHRYNADGTFGSSWHAWTINTKLSKAIQEDETALPIYGLWVHFITSHDYFTLREVYDNLEKAAEFLVEFMDDKLGLPLMSFDLWEERLGVHIFTVATVYAALRAASHLARNLGEWGKEERWGRIAEGLRSSVAEKFFDKNHGHYARSLTISDGKVEALDPTLDSSVLSLAIFGLIDPRDPRFVATVNSIKERLWVKGVGGLARYENDYYQRVPGDYSGIPGNPWIITTMWYAQVLAIMGDRDGAQGLLSWAADKASPTGMLPEQLSPFNAGPLSVMPLAWSHAEYLRTYALLKGMISMPQLP